MKDRNPNLILDFELIEESLYLRFYNNSDYEAHNVRVGFGHPFPGMGGKKIISDISIFTGLKYMAPRKEFLIYIDQIDSFFCFYEQEELSISISCKNYRGRRLKKRIVHNLNIYKDLPVTFKKK